MSLSLLGDKRVYQVDVLLQLNYLDTYIYPLKWNILPENAAIFSETLLLNNLVFSHV